MRESKKDYLTAEKACSVLEVKRATLYSYASRGLLRSVANTTGRARLYLRADVERLRMRHDARAGHTAVASSALRWGEPVLDSSITEISSEGPVYRGESAVKLAERHVSFERVAELLWNSRLPATTSIFGGAPDMSTRRVLGTLSEPQHLSDAFFAVVTSLRASDLDLFVRDEEVEKIRARRILACSAILPALVNGKAPKLEQASLAARLAVSFGKKATQNIVRSLDAALVLVADHELSASAFSARVTASTGADLYSCILSALATFFGPLHGGECDRVESLVAQLSSSTDAKAFVRDRRARGEALSGFSHRLYPEGDPRATPLLALANSAGSSARTASIFALVKAMKQTGGDPPTVDTGLVALAHALALPRGAATMIFAVGRIAGWVAHVFEQRATQALLRPRARFVPVSSEPEVP